MKNKVAVTLASLFKDGQIGRLAHLNSHFYGVLNFFDESKVQLKEEFKNDLTKLILTI